MNKNTSIVESGLPIKPCYYYRDYHDVNGMLDGTLLSIWHEDPSLLLDLFHSKRNPEDQTRAMKLDRLLRCAILTPEKFRERLHLCEKNAEYDRSYV